MVFHGGSFGNGLRAVRAQKGAFFIQKQKKTEGGAGKGGFGGRVVE